MEKLQKTYRFGQYRRLNTIASKGAIKIYEGIHLELGRMAVIKALYLQQIGEKRERLRAGERFHEEACRLEHIRHPHIVELYEYGEENSVAYIVMQFAPYGSLASLYPLGSLLPFALIRRYARQIGGALQALHDAGWIHRDVKPGNVFLGSRKQALLGDFGLVVEDRSREAPRRMLEYGGTRMYMAPEQAHGEPCQASDQYALATMLFEWLTGCRPFEGTPEQVLWQRHYYPAPSLRELAPDIPAEVERVVLKALRIAPQHRFASVGKFVQALESAFDPPPVRHAAPAPVRDYYYAGTSHPSRSRAAHRHDTQPGQRVVLRHARAVASQAQPDELSLQPLPISIHEADFELYDNDFELLPAGGEGFVRKVLGRLGSLL